MAIRFRCEKCGQKLRVATDRIGQQAKCPRCKEIFRVPVESQPEDAGSATAVPAPPVAPPAVKSPGRPARATVASTISETVKASATAPPKPEAPSTAADSQATDLTPAADPISPIQPPTMPPSDETPPTAVGTGWPDIVIHEEDVEWVYESNEPVAAKKTSPIDDVVSVPRRVLYIQGAMIGIVGVVAFAIGVFVGGGNNRDDGSIVGQPLPCKLVGSVTVRGSSDRRPDAGAVILAFPADRLPPNNSRVASEGLRPDDPAPDADHLAIRTIMSFGGQYARTNADGEYQFQLPDAGRYHVLVVSNSSRRPSGRPPELADVGQIGRFVQQPAELLGDFRYEWRDIIVRRDQTLDVEF